MRFSGAAAWPGRVCDRSILQLVPAWLVARRMALDIFGGYKYPRTGGWRDVKSCGSDSIIGRSARVEHEAPLAPRFRQGELKE